MTTLPCRRPSDTGIESLRDIDLTEERELY